MKTFHIHLIVDALAANIEFYSQLFGQNPTKQREDYAKWELDEPRVHFALSSGYSTLGINHLGMAADSASTLQDIKQLAENAAVHAETKVLDSPNTQCCYAKSDKHWLVDPQGIAWEFFHTTGESNVLKDASVDENPDCCIPIHRSDNHENSDCCIPNNNADHSACC